MADWEMIHTRRECQCVLKNNDPNAIFSRIIISFFPFNPVPNQTPPEEADWRATYEVKTRTLSKFQVVMNLENLRDRSKELEGINPQRELWMKKRELVVGFDMQPKMLGPHAPALSITSDEGFTSDHIQKILQTMLPVIHKVDPIPEDMVKQINEAFKRYDVNVDLSAPEEVQAKVEEETPRGPSGP